MSDGSLPHFAGVVVCNSLLENALLFFSVSFFILFFIFFRDKKYLIKLDETTKPSKFLCQTAKISTTVVVVAALFLWWKTGLNIVPDKLARNTLVVHYHAVFGHPLVAPFLYISIISTTYIYAVYKERWLWLTCILAISFGCYVTMSRGFILSMLLPFLVTQPIARMIKFSPLLIFIFFLRDILNGSIFLYAEASANLISTSIDALGEFTNTYFGRRYFIDNNIPPDYAIFINEVLLKASGIYYLFSPFFKMLASLGMSLPSSTQEINNGIEGLLGLTGFAGSYLSDLAIFFPVSLMVAFLCFSTVSALYAKVLKNSEKYVFILIAAMLLPNAFRWSMTGYLAMLSGMLIGYCLVRIFISTRHLATHTDRVVMKRRH